MEMLIEELKRDEGLSLTPYRCPAGKLSIGYGRNLEDKGISEAEAELLLRHDIQFCCDRLKRLVFWRDLNEVRRDVLINMCFNIGFAGLLKFKRMIKALELGEYSLAADEMLDSRWARQVKGRAHRLSKMMRLGHRYIEEVDQPPVRVT